MVEARARFGRVVGLKTTKKGVWKGKQGQNGVVLACSFKITETKQRCFCSKIKNKNRASIYPLQPDTGEEEKENKKKKKKEEEEEKKEVGD